MFVILSQFFYFFLLQFVELGIVTSIECNHKSVETARKGQEVCIKIESLPGDAPKMFGRHFEETDILMSKVRLFFLIYCYSKFRLKEKIKFKIYHRQ